MPCRYPVEGFRGPSGEFVMARHKSTGLRMRVPCGRCILCRLERSRQWAVRIMHEAQMHESNSFLTLTYSDEELPYDGSLEHRDFQLFMKRLRKKSGPLRYFMCGEYGEEKMRPHYHCCLFGEDFARDRTPWMVSNGNPLYRSPKLEDAWGLGHALIGELTFESAAYVARYCLKKITAPSTRIRVDVDTGEILPVQAEYGQMSRGGRSGKGIGFSWFEKYRSDVYPEDEVIARGHPSKPPRRYDAYLRDHSEEEFQAIKRERIRARDRSEETPERLEAKAICAEAMLKRRGDPNEAVGF